ncbi:restriction endonuclease subunit S [Methylomagnum sp.]
MSVDQKTLAESVSLVQDWPIKCVGDICDTYSGGTPPRSASGMFGGSIPWVKSSELNQKSIESTEEFLTGTGFSSCSAKWIPENTPLIAMYGATAGVVSWLSINATTNQAVLALVPKTEDIDPRWLYWRIFSDSDKLLSSVQGSGQSNLSKEIIERHFVRVPRKSEQIALASIEMFPRCYKYTVHNCYFKVHRVKSSPSPYDPFLMALPR